MALTYTAIASVTVGSGGAANMEFTNIPGTYTDLQVWLSTRTNRGNEVDAFSVAMNNDTTASNYRFTGAFQTGGGVSTNTYNTYFEELAWTSGNNATASCFGVSSFYIADYASTTKHKPVSVNGGGENNGTNARTGMAAFVWKSNSAITSLKFLPISGTLFQQYSTATLYGIKNTV